MPKKLVVIITIACLVALATGVGWFIHARSQSAYADCGLSLRMIDAAKQTWAVKENKTTNDVPTWDDLKPYFVISGLPKCPDGGIYTIGRLDEMPRCSIGGPRHSLE
jgi:hypothetical protein